MLKIEKLEDILLENVSGGDDSYNLIEVHDGSSEPRKFPIGSSIAITAIGAVGAVGCSVAAAACKAVSVKAMNQGNIAKSATYQGAAVSLGACVAPFATIGIISGVGTFKHIRRIYFSQ